MGNSAPNSSTRPTTPSNTTVASLRKRLETLENQVKRINANRTPTPLLVHQLSNTGPMSVVKDGQTLVYNEASGQYEPGVSAYASLRGAGQTDSPGALTQTGGLFIVLGDVLADSSEAFFISSTTTTTSVEVDAFATSNPTSGGAQFAAQVGNATTLAKIVMGVDPTGPSNMFIQADSISLGPSTGQLEFFGAGGNTIQTITGSRGGNAALGSLINALHSYGLIIDGSTP